jgi:hypothetical protein
LPDRILEAFGGAPGQFDEFHNCHRSLPNMEQARWGSLA